VEIFQFLQDGGRPPWICDVHVWTTNNGHFGDLYHCAKFGSNRCGIVDNMHVNFLRLLLENAY